MSGSFVFSSYIYIYGHYSIGYPLGVTVVKWHSFIWRFQCQNLREISEVLGLSALVQWCRPLIPCQEFNRLNGSGHLCLFSCQAPRHYKQLRLLHLN